MRWRNYSSKWAPLRCVAEDYLLGTTNDVAFDLAPWSQWFQGRLYFLTVSRYTAPLYVALGPKTATASNYIFRKGGRDGAVRLYAFALK